MNDADLRGRLIARFGRRHYLPKVKIKRSPPRSPLPVPRVPVDTKLNGPERPSSQVKTPSPSRWLTYTKLPLQVAPFDVTMVRLPPPSMYPVAVPVNVSVEFMTLPRTGKVMLQDASKTVQIREAERSSFLLTLPPRIKVEPRSGRRSGFALNELLGVLRWISPNMLKNGAISSVEEVLKALIRTEISIR